MSRWLVPIGVFAAVGGLILRRQARDPVEAYGEHGAEWIEHFDRLGTLVAWRSNTGSFFDFLGAADSAYPPLLHVLTLPFGVAAQEVVWTGLLWWGLLAVGVALTARGLLPDEPWAGPAGATAALLLPAGHGAAARYYYDLPMTALLWLGVGLIMSVRRDWLAGLAGGAAAGLAAPVKWTAIPFAGPMIVAAILARRKGPTVALIAAAGIGFAAPSAGYLAISTHSWVEMMGTFGPNEDPLGSVGDAAARTLHADPKLQAPDRTERSGGRIERGGWYAGRMVTAVLSPAGLMILGALLVTSRRNENEDENENRSAGRAGGRVTPKAARPQDGRQDGAHNENRGRLSSGQRLSVLALVIAGGHVAFVTLMVPPLDERFLLTAAPALMLAGVLGWTRSPHRAAAGAAAIVGFLAVAVDFHTGDASALDPQTTIMMDEPSAGFGLRGSWERRGWGPAGRSRPSPHPLREDVWAAVGAVHAKRVGVIGAPLFDPFGDRWWWRYRARLGEVDGTWKRQGELKVVHLCKGGDPPDVDVIIASDARVQPIDRPWCPAAGDWAPGRRIAAPPPTVGAVVWYPRGVKPGRPTAD